MKLINSAGDIQTTNWKPLKTIAIEAQEWLLKGGKVAKRRKPMIARDVETTLLNRCATVAREIAPRAQDQREANVFRLASMVVRSTFPRESNSLMLASEQYFAAHPNELLNPGEVIRNGWVMNLPRLRDMLSRRLSYISA